MESLLGDFKNFDLRTLNCVPFVPNNPVYQLDIKLAPTPRYLYRVFDSSSLGQSDGVWVRSQYADKHRREEGNDIFSLEDRSQAAISIWDHLKWRKNASDDLMSWTSSLLFAIQYVFYRHNKHGLRTSYKDIKICILDTKGIPSGAFIRDLDLVKAFAPYNDNLKEFGDFRRRTYYFGEYLSQGALKIAGHNKIVSAQDMIHSGLTSLRPEFESSREDDACGWANNVVQMYRALENDLATPDQPQDPKLVRNAIQIALLFGRNFRWHVATSLAAIVPGNIDVETIASAFREVEFNSEYRDRAFGILREITKQTKGEERLTLSRMDDDERLSDVLRTREVQRVLRAESYQYDLQACLSSAQMQIANSDNIAWTLKRDLQSGYWHFEQIAACKEKVNEMLECLQELNDALAGMLITP